MSYVHLNIGQLLFLLPNTELKQRVRTLERFYKCYITAITGIIFSKTYICICDSQSDHIYIYIHQSSNCIRVYNALFHVTHHIQSQSLTIHVTTIVPTSAIYYRHVAKLQSCTTVRLINSHHTHYRWEVLLFCLSECLMSVTISEALQTCSRVYNYIYRILLWLHLTVNL